MELLQEANEIDYTNALHNPIHRSSIHIGNLCLTAPKIEQSHPDFLLIIY